MRRSLLLWGAKFAAVLLVGTTGGAALAQGQRPTAPAPAPAAGQATLPPAVEVNDPMLAPVTRPKTEIATWDEALRHIRARSLDLRSAAAEVLRAEGASRAALGGALLTINGTGQYTHNLITNDTLQPVQGSGGLAFNTVQTPFPDFFNLALVASQPVFAPRAWYAIGTAHRQEDVARLSLEDAKRVIALGVASAIVAVVSAERVAELNRNGLRNALTRLELATRKTALGSGTAIDVVRARTDVETARQTLVGGDEDLRKAREALGLAVGLPEQVGVPPNVDLNGLETNARASCKPTDGIDNRADIQSLNEATVVAHRQRNDVKLQFSPTVDLRSSVATTTVNTGAAPNTTWNIQAVLTVPLWEGGVRYGNLRTAEAAEAVAGVKLETARRKAQIEVTQAKRAVGVADDRRRVAATARDLAAENDRLTRAAYVEGRGTSLELVTAAAALRDAEIQLAVRDFDVVKARIAAVLTLSVCPW